MKNKIDVHEFSFFYGEFQALIDITMPIPENQITALIGPSGCGKSTFLRSINRMNDTIKGTHADGEILLDGKNVYDEDVDVVELRQRIGMVFQRPNPFPTMSIADNVLAGKRLNSKRFAKGEAEELVEKSLRGANLWDEVKDRLDKPGSGLSGGQQQRLCIARAIATQPDVILMDEPCSALDPIATLRIEELMLELKSNYSIIIVTHNMQQAARVSDKTAFFNVALDTKGQRTGHLVEFTPTDELFTSPKEKSTEDYITGRIG